jgi:N6-L-threonylcarbamoyladenine synthase
LKAHRPILAIESSCDETAIAIISPPDQLHVSLIASQSKLHAPFGGVVPEVASRNHLLTIDPLFHDALTQARLKPTDLGAVVATAGPGLAPALLVGASYAKGVALALGIPYLAINHLEGHLVSPFFLQKNIPPHLSLVVSGGHTQLTKVLQGRHYQLLGRTHDDAAGEAFDKLDKLLGLPYPGCCEIDRLARLGNSKGVSFPRALMEKENLDFSFSGLKTSVRYFLDARGSVSLSDSELQDICASIEEAIVEVLCEKTRRAAQQHGLTCIGVSGGVAANRGLRLAMHALCEKHAWELHFPPRELTSDNAAMIAFAGMHRLLAGETTSVTSEIIPQWQIY